MWLVVVMIVAILGIVIGPIMWVVPSNRDKRIAKLRNYAAEQGARVRLVAKRSLPGIAEDKDSSPNLVRYSINWTLDKSEDDERNKSNLTSKPENSPWRLQAGRIEHESHFSGAWQWAKDLVADQKWHSALRANLDRLPSDVIAIENTPYDLAIYWQEKGSAEEVDQVVSFLKTLRSIG